MNFFRILCVDDNAPFQTALKLGLGVYGFEVIAASHGIDALMQYKAYSGDFGAIVTDNDMPQRGGLEFVRAVRKMGYIGRIVVMSGNLTPESLRAYLEHSISGFFHKPFEISLLAAMLLQAD
jgi:chemotaxis family two-component system sensor histidine kinase/response regulator PixL